MATGAGIARAAEFMATLHGRDRRLKDRKKIMNGELGLPWEEFPGLLSAFSLSFSFRLYTARSSAFLPGHPTY